MKYARQLRELHARCLNDAGFRLDVLGYSNEMSVVHETTNGQGEGENTYGNIQSEHRSIPNGSLNSQYHGDTTTPTNHNESERQHSSSNSIIRPSHIPPEYNNQPTSHPHPPQLSIATPNYQSNHDNTLTPPPGSNDVILTPTYQPQQSHHMPYPHPPSTNSDDELSLISHTLLGQQFLEMDRVISFDDTTFVLDCMGGVAGGNALNGDAGGGWAPAAGHPPGGLQEGAAVGGEYTGGS